MKSEIEFIALDAITSKALSFNNYSVDATLLSDRPLMLPINPSDLIECFIIKVQMD